MSSFFNVQKFTIVTASRSVGFFLCLNVDLFDRPEAGWCCLLLKPNTTPVQSVKSIASQRRRRNIKPKRAYRDSLYCSTENESEVEKKRTE